MSAEKMTAADVRAALTRRWPDDQYLHIYEAPLDSSRMGTKIDVLVLSLWASRRHAVDAVEVKVSYSDWRKEIARTEWTVAGVSGRVFPTKWQADMSRHRSLYGGPCKEHACFGLPERHVVEDTSKSALWRGHCDRFWIACPATLAEKIRPELPEKWGLIGCDAAGTHTLVPALGLTRTPFSWPATVGLLRAGADSGMQALRRAEDRGFQRGCAHVRAEIERDSRVLVAGASGGLQSP